MFFSPKGLSQLLIRPHIFKKISQNISILIFNFGKINLTIFTFYLLMSELFKFLRYICISDITEINYVIDINFKHWMKILSSCKTVKL